MNKNEDEKELFLNAADSLATILQYLTGELQVVEKEKEEE